MHGKSVLIVDDDPDIRIMLADLLELEGYRVRTAGNGVEALQSVETCEPALVILDLWMPVLNGSGFASELDQRGIDLPILVMTAAPNADGMAAEIGADDFVQKPFELGEILDSVARLYKA